MKMKYDPIKILAIETSCDETAAAVIGEQEIEEARNRGSKKNIPVILSNIVSSQVDLHAKTGGVVPEVASRAHIEAMIPVIEEAIIKGTSKSKSLISNEMSNNYYPKKLQANKLRPDQLSQITHIAVTTGPGLIGSLLVGFNTAKSLAYALNVPLIPINHIEGHIYSALAQNRITNNQDAITKQSSNFKSENLKPKKLTPNAFPLLALTVSGGHTSLTLMHDHGKYESIGATIDDAAGEAFDKVAKLLGLGYPGGPIVSQYAAAYREKISKSEFLPLRSTSYEGQVISNENKENQYFKLNKPKKLKPNAYGLTFPRPMLDKDNFDFSFSGLKTAVLYAVQKIQKQENEKLKNQEKNGGLSEDIKQKICYEFEEAVVEVLVTKTIKAAEKFGVKGILVAGGVIANKRLREAFAEAISNDKTQISNEIPKNNAKKLNPKAYKLLMPPMELCGDNAAMIGLAAYYHALRGDVSSWDKIKVDSNLKL